MFKRLAMLVRGLMGCQSTDRSMSQVEQPLDNAKPLHAKSTQTSKAALKQPRKPSLAPTQRKPKPDSAPSTKAVRKSGKKKPTAQTVATASQRQPTGSKSKTVAPQTRQVAKPAPKRKP